MFLSKDNLKWSTREFGINPLSPSDAYMRQGTYFSEIRIKMLTFPFKKMCLEMSYGKWGHFTSASMC